jgi:hypothetical protein
LGQRNLAGGDKNIDAVGLLAKGYVPSSPGLSPKEIRGKHVSGGTENRNDQGPFPTENISSKCPELKWLCGVSSEMEHNLISQSSPCPKMP